MSSHTFILPWNLFCIFILISLSYAACSEEALTDQSGMVNSTMCTDRGLANSSSISGGVVCYNGTTVGSRAVYICNDGFILVEGDEATRICQSDANWNGSIPRSISQEKGTSECRFSQWIFFFASYINILSFASFLVLILHMPVGVVLRLQWQLDHLT